MNAGAQNPYLPKLVNLKEPGVTFFVRHGQCRSNTEWPIADYHDGLDPLSELGESQAKSCARFLKTLLPGVTWRVSSSSLLRAIQTAEIIAACTGSNLAGRDARLNEFSSDEEDHPALLRRVGSFLSDLGGIVLAQRERHLVVTHGHVLECLLCQALGAAIRVIDKGGYGGQAGLVSHANGGVSAFHNGELLLWNAQMHLLDDGG